VRSRLSSRSRRCALGAFLRDEAASRYELPPLAGPESARHHRGWSQEQEGHNEHPSHRPLPNGSEFSCTAAMPRYLTLVGDDGARNYLMLCEPCQTAILG
jgi:hypothetical protein